MQILQILIKIYFRMNTIKPQNLIEGIDQGLK